MADIVREAKRLSGMHTSKQGHRSFDILHVATALVRRADKFLTFDENQKKLAEAERLDVPF
jgi:predicted nucleic acid-binding protein